MRNDNPPRPKTPAKTLAKTPAKTPPGAAKARVRPRDAATLVILDPDPEPDRTRVLMGRRAPKHDFLPNVFVFPGGRVDKTDRHSPSGRGLDRQVADKIEVAPAQAHALATAAIRETFEETGLALLDQADSAAPQPLPPRPEPGARHGDEGVAGGVYSSGWPGPGLIPRHHVLDYLGRAITPAPSPKRFDTRFFVAHAMHAEGELEGNGELLDLDWYPLPEALKLPLIDVTEFMLRQVQELLRTGRPVGPGFCLEPVFFSWRRAGGNSR